MQHVPGTKLRSISAKELNRAIAAGRDRDAGLANLSSRDLNRARENGHILVRNQTGATVKIFSVLGYNNPRTEFYSESQNLFWQRAVWDGATIDLKQHWFAHCVLQQHATAGEVVPAAVNGLTFARVNEGGSSNLRQTMARLCEAQPYLNSGDSEGCADIVGNSAGGSATEQKPALIRMGRVDELRLLRLTERVDADEFKCTLWNETGATAAVEFTAYDPAGLAPPTSALGPGVASYFAWGKPHKGYSQTGTPSYVAFYLTSIQRSMSVLGLSGGSSSPTSNPLFWLN